MMKTKSAQDTIPYRAIYKNGIIETQQGTFTKAYLLTDINFRTTNDEEQLRIFQGYEDLLNMFTPQQRFQILIYNHSGSKRKLFDIAKFEPQSDGLNRYRSDMNNILVNNMQTARNNIIQEKYLIVSITEDSVLKATEEYERLDRTIAKTIRKIDPAAQAVPQTINQRLRTLFSIYNQDDTSFNNAVDDKGIQYFSLDKVYKDGLTSKDMIAPSGISFKSDSFTIGEMMGQTLFLKDTPNYLTDSFIEELANLPFTSLISIQHSPINQEESIKKVKDKMTSINSQIAQSQKNAGQQGYSADLVSPELAIQKEQAMNLYNDLLSRDEKMFFITFTVTVFGANKEEVTKNSGVVGSIGTKHLCPLISASWQQEDALQTTLPLCVNNLPVKRLLKTTSAAIFLPYSSQELMQKNGFCYGINQVSNNTIIYSRLSGQNFNGLIFGKSGSGKSFFAKLEMLSVLLRDPQNVVYVIDPEKEYVNLARKLGGEAIELSTGATSFLNPFDMDLEYSGDADPIAMKADYVLGMIDIMLGGDATLDPIARSIVDRCVRNIYRGYVAHIDNVNKAGRMRITNDKEATPTLNDLYIELKRQPEVEASTIADIIEIYATGAPSLFAQRTNVDIDNRFVVYDIMNLGTGMKSLGLYVCLNDIWNKVIANQKKGIFTWFYIDEFYLLLQSDSATRFLMNIWKRARKWNGVPTGIMQNTEDLLVTSEARNIINNTSFITALSLSKLDRINLGELLKISDEQLKYATNGAEGTGLLCTDKTVIPFKNEIPKNSSIYKLLSTSKTKDELGG